MAHTPRSAASKKIGQILFLIVLISCVTSLKLQAQTDTVFWFAAPEIDSTHADSTLFRFASESATTITVSIPANPSFTPVVINLGAKQTYTLSMNDIAGVDCKNLIENTAYDQVANKGILIKSISKISAYYEIKTMPNSEVFALKGKNALGKVFFANFQNYWHNKYPLMSDGDKIVEFGTQDSLPLWTTNDAEADYQDIVATNSWSSFDIVATEDGTTITITPTNPIVSSSSVIGQYGYVTNGVFHGAGVTYTITLDKGQTYSARQAWKNPSRSIGGTKIAADKNIAVTVKEDGLVAWNHDNASVTNPDGSTINIYDFDNYGFDVIGDQLVPIDLTGDNYIVMRGGVYPDIDQNPNTPPTDYDWDGERVFFTATEDGTVLTIKSYNNAGTLLNTTTSTSLNSGQVYTYTFKYDQYTTSNIEQFLQISSNSSHKFYTYHVSGQYSELGSAIIPTVGVCTGSTQLAFTRSHNGLFQVNLMVKQGAEDNFQVRRGQTDVTSSFGIQASNFITIPGSGWSVYTLPNNIWTNKATIDSTYIISNTENVFHLGILNISEFPYIDTTRIPQYIGWYTSSGYTKYTTFTSGSTTYDCSGTIPTSVIETIWGDTNWTKTTIESTTEHIYYALKNDSTDSTLFVAHWKSNNRGAFYGYFSDFNEFDFGAEFSDKDSVICAGGCISLKSYGGVKYLWSANIWPYLENLSDTSSAEITICGMPAGTYTASVHIEGFCQDTGDAELTFTVLPKPDVTITGSSSICQSSPTATYSVTQVTGNTYAWTVAGGTITSGQSTSSIAVEWTTIGTHTVSVVVNNGTCDADTGSLTVNVNTPPDAQNHTFVTCVGVPSTFDASPTGGSTPYSDHSWTITSTPVAYTTDGSSITLTPSSAGVSIFKYVVTDANSCKDSATIYVQAYQNPVISGLTSPTNVCQLSSKTITATITGKANPQPTWSSTSSFLIIPSSELNSSTINLITTTEGSYPLRLIATDTIGCADTADITVNIYPKPVAAVSSETSVCQNDSVVLTGQTYPNVVTYTWEGADVSKLSPNARVTTFVSSEARAHYLDFIVITDHGCSDTLNYTITVNENPIVSLGTDVSTCSGVLKVLSSNVSEGSGSYTYYWYDDNGDFDLPHTSAPTYNETASGTHNVYLKIVDDVTQCSDIDTVVVTIFENPTVAPTSTEVCLNEAIVLDGQPTGGSGVWVSHQWSGSNVANLTANQATQTPTFESSVAGPHYLTYKVTDSNNCTAQGDATITVNALPEPVISNLTSLEVCAEADLQLSVTNVPTSYSFSWTGSGAASLSSTSIYNPVFQNATAGTYTLIVAASDSNSCIGYDTISVTVNPLPTPVVASDSLCSGSTITLEGDARYTSHKWSGDVSGIPAAELTSQNPTFTSTTPGIYSITYTATDNNGCSDSVELTVKVNANPAVDAGSDIGIAYGDTAQLNVVPNGSGYSYTWTPADSISGSNTIYNPVTIPLHKTTVFWVTVVDNITSCKDSDFVSVVDTTGSLLVDITPMPGIICQGDTAYLNIDVSGGKRPYTYTWTPTPEHVYANGDARVRPSVTTTYYVTVEDQNGTTEADSVVITVNQLPVVTLVDTALCSNDSILITPTITTQSGATVASVLWTGGGTAGLNGVTTVANVWFYTETSGSYPLTLTATDNNSCKNSASMNVTVNELPGVSIIASSETCAGIAVALTVNNTTSASIVTYAWSEATPTHLAATSGATNSFTSDNDGDITLNVVDANGCEGTATYHIDVNANPVALIEDTSVCQNTKLLLDGKPSGGSGSYTTQAWTGDVTTLSALDIQTPAFSTADTGTFSVTYTVTDSKTCLGTTTIDVTVNNLPTATYSQDMDVCQGSPLEITAYPTPLESISVNMWIEPGKPLQGNSTSVTIISDTVGVKEIYYYVETNEGCSITDTLDITILPKPTITINPDNTQICEGIIDSLRSTYSGGTNTPLSYTWSTSPASPVVLNASNTPTVAFQKTDMGSVVVSLVYVDANTCSDTAEVTIQVNPTPAVTIASDALHACQGQSLSIDANPTSISKREYTWIGGTGLTYLDATTGSTVNFTCDTVGTYTLVYRIRETQYSCQTTDTIIVNVTASPERKTITEKICQVVGGVLSLDATQGSVSSYVWQGSRTDLLSSTSSASTAISLSTAGVFEYNIIETTADNCTDTSTATITVVQTPTVEIPASVGVFYQQSYTFAPVVTGVEPLAYSWTDASFFVDATTKNATTIPLTQATTVTVRVTETSSGLGCYDTAQTAFTIELQLDLTVDKDSVCPGESVTLTATITGGATVTSYTWTTDQGTITTSGNTYTYVPTSSHTASVTVSNGTNSLSDQVTITVNPRPSSVNLTKDLCSGNSWLAELNITNATTYVWTGTHTELLSNTNQGSSTFGPTDQIGTFVYNINASNTYGCSNVSTVTIINNLTPEVETINITVCASDKTQIPVYSNPAGVITWSSTIASNLALLSSTTGNAPIFSAPSTSGTYTYTVSSTTGSCTGTTTATITVYDRPSVTIPGEIWLFQGQDTTLELTSNANYLYAWSPGTLVSNPAILNTTINPITAYTELVLTTTSQTAIKNGLSSGCPVYDTLKLQLYQAMIVQIDDVTICSGDTAMVVASVYNGGPNKKYYWTIGSGTTFEDDDTITFVPTSSTSITVSVYDGYYTQTATAQVNYHESPSVTIIPQLTALVQGESHNLVASVSGGTPRYTISWSNNSNGIMEPTNTYGTTYTATTTGEQIINVTVSDSYGCTASDSIKPAAMEMPDWPSVVCAGSSYTFTYYSTVDIKVVVEENDSTYEYDGATALTFENTGTVVISIYDLSDPSPIYVDSIVVSSSIYVDFSYTPDQSITIDEQVQFNNLALGEENRFIIDNLVFYWDFVGDNIYTSEAKAPVYLYDDTGIFNVTLIAVDTVSQCRDSVTKNLEVIVNPDCELKFPNTFTPEEANNSTFLPGYIVGIQDKDYNLKIFNRWGQLLFETNNKQEGWDGYFNDQICKQDVYVYQCEALCETGEVKYINGDVTLIK